MIEDRSAWAFPEDTRRVAFQGFVAIDGGCPRRRRPGRTALDSRHVGVEPASRASWYGQTRHPRSAVDCDARSAGATQLNGGSAAD
jgi:hypothetical protein